MTSLWRAPSDLRMPISRVRSVTLTSMIFMITMPPTTREMHVTGTTTAAIMPSTWSIKPRMASGVSVSKLSGSWPGRVWKARAQRETRVSGPGHPARVQAAGLVWGGRRARSRCPSRTEPVERGDRDIDGIVLVAAKRGAELLLHTDHGELDALNADLAVERRGVSGGKAWS